MTEIEILSSLLRKKGLKVCSAESFTGGGIASSFVALPGASDVFTASLVCYVEQAKVKLLGVLEDTLKRFGAVSEQTVSEMLDGLERLNLADVFIATSGNAGPSAEKNGEVGLFYIGVKYKGIKQIKKFRVDGNRKQIIDCGVSESLKLILATIND